MAGADGDAPLTARQTDLRGPIALVVGSEGQGLGPAVRKRCDLFVRIPLRGAIGSLNAAVAGSVLLFEIAAQRDPDGTATRPLARNVHVSSTPVQVKATPEPASAPIVEAAIPKPKRAPAQKATAKVVATPHPTPTDDPPATTPKAKAKAAKPSVAKAPNATKTKPAPNVTKAPKVTKPARPNVTAASADTTKMAVSKPAARPKPVAATKAKAPSKSSAKPGGLKASGKATAPEVRDDDLLP